MVGQSSWAFYSCRRPRPSHHRIRHRPQPLPLVRSRRPRGRHRDRGLRILALRWDGSDQSAGLCRQDRRPRLRTQVRTSSSATPKKAKDPKKKHAQGSPGSTSPDSVRSRASWVVSPTSFPLQDCHASWPARASDTSVRAGRSRSDPLHHPSITTAAAAVGLLALLHQYCLAT